jgi:hypothetical protein
VHTLRYSFEPQTAGSFMCRGAVLRTHSEEASAQAATAAYCLDVLL